ncbi:MAG: site-specific integrase [Chitinophagaceae bacterium]|nr:site-specific integrase [Chitinophagaceae bacterium]
MATVQIVHRKDKLNKKGEAPIHFRIIKNRKTSYIASGILLPIEQWDERKIRVKSTHRNSARLNSYLSNKFTEIQDIVLEQETLSKSLTSRNLRDKVFGKKPLDFFDFADKVVAKYKEEGKIGTYDKNIAIISKLRKFKPNSRLTFNDITPEFLLKYEQYLKTELKNKTNTINKDMKFIRKVFNDAIREDIIGLEVTPFRKYSMKLDKTHKEYLTEEELMSLEKYPATPGSRLDLHRDMFVFASYAGGLRVSDIVKLQWKDFDGTHLNLVIKKTGTQVSIKVPNKALEIIRKYVLQSPNKDSFVFPMMPENTNLNDPEELDASISRATAYINKNLKIIAEAVGIEKNLSFHISRHTFAVMALKKGISIDKVSKLMAHSNIRETQIYAKVVNEELDKAMDAFN